MGGSVLLCYHHTTTNHQDIFCVWQTFNQGKAGTRLPNAEPDPDLTGVPIFESEFFPRSEPSLIPLSSHEWNYPDYPLSVSQKSALTGTYQNEDETVVVDLRQDRLRLTNALSGSFFLFPESDTEFVIEDERYRVHFDLGDSKKAASLQIRITADLAFELFAAPD